VMAWRSATTTPESVPGRRPSIPGRLHGAARRGFEPPGPNRGAPAGPTHPNPSIGREGGEPPSRKPVWQWAPTGSAGYRGFGIRRPRPNGEYPGSIADRDIATRFKHWEIGATHQPGEAQETKRSRASPLTTASHKPGTGHNLTKPFCRAGIRFRYDIPRHRQGGILNKSGDWAGWKT